MTLRRRTLVMTGVVLGLLLLALYGSLRVILGTSYARLERSDTSEAVGRALSALSTRIEQLDTFVGDWAPWDDTKLFVLGQYPGYPEQMLTASSLSTLDVSLLLYADASGQIVASAAYDVGAGELVPVPEGVLQHFAAHSSLLRSETVDTTQSGLVMIEGQPLLVAAHPILDNLHQGPIAGTLVAGRYLDAGLVQLLAEKTLLSLSLFPFADPQMPVDVRQASSALLASEAVYVQPLDQHAVAGYTLLRDAYGEPGLILRVSMPRRIYEQGREAMSRLVLLLLLHVGLFTLLIMLFLEKAVLARIQHLTASLTRIKERADPAMRVPLTPLKQRDELWHLGSIANEMLGALESSEQELRRARDELEVRVQERTAQLAWANQELRRAHDELEVRVQERTAQLAEANQVLQSEVAERKRAQQETAAALREREVLLKEIHHRVKNNLQVICSVLYLQSEDMPNQEMARLLQETEQRVRIMALVHEELYEGTSLAQIDLAQYIPALLEHVLEAYHGSREAEIVPKLEIESLFVDMDRAIPCGLIVNELVSNSLKYAFPHEGKGEVRVAVRPGEAGQIVLCVGDNGVGLPKGPDFQHTSSLGLQLVNVLVQQLRGTITLKPHEGTCYEILFPSQKSAVVP